MFNSNNILYIISALAASEKAMFYAQSYTNPEEFFEANDQMPFNATLTLLMVIGEEVKKTDTNILNTQPNILWVKIVDMRNFLAHDYRGVDEDIVFDVVKNELPKLSVAFISFLQLFPQTEIEDALQHQCYKHLYPIIFKN